MPDHTKRYSDDIIEDLRAVAAWHAHKSSSAFRGEREDEWLTGWFERRRALLRPGHPGLTDRSHETYDTPHPHQAKRTK